MNGASDQEAGGSQLRSRKPSRIANPATNVVRGSHGPRRHRNVEGRSATTVVNTIDAAR